MKLKKTDEILSVSDCIDSGGRAEEQFCFFPHTLLCINDQNESCFHVPFVLLCSIYLFGFVCNLSYLLFCLNWLLITQFTGGHRMVVVFVLVYQCTTVVVSLNMFSYLA